MQTLGVSRDGRYIVGSVELEGEPACTAARPHHLQLLLELAAKINGGYVHRYRSSFDTGEVEELLGHAQHALRLLVDDGRRAGPLYIAEQAPVDERLAEADEAGQWRLQLVRDVGQEISLRLASPLHGLSHPVESRAEQAELILAFDADPPRVVSRGDVLRRRCELGQRPGHRSTDEKDQQHRHNERSATGFEQTFREVARSRRRGE